jgi:hypothetical protein
MVIRIIGAACAFALIQLASAQAAEITVMRGAKTEIVNTAKRGALVVQRGTPTVAKRQAKAAPAATGQQGFPVAGGVLWMKDEDGRLRACRLMGNGMAGQRVIRCTGR